MSKKLSDRWEAFASRFAVVLAVMALGVSLWSFWETRKHNRSSVMPYVEFGLVRGPSESIPYPGIWVTNYGSGVAILEELVVHVDDEPAESWQQALDTIGLLGRDDLRFLYRAKLGNYLGPGERRCVICSNQEPFRNEHHDIMMEAFGHLSLLHLDYCSMYGQCDKAQMRFSTSSLP